MLKLPPAVIVHSLPDAHRALVPNRPVTLLSAPGAALFAGCAFWRELVRQAHAAHPHTPMHDVLDCADASGYALAALRMHQHIIVLDRDAPGRHAVIDIARQHGHHILPNPPPAFDLSGRATAQGLEAWLRGNDIEP